MGLVKGRRFHLAVAHEGEIPEQLRARQGFWSKEHVSCLTVSSRFDTDGARGPKYPGATTIL